MVNINLYPFKALTKANPIPVLPLVGSTIMLPSRKSPSRSACSIMARATRSFTLPPGLNASILATTRAFASMSFSNCPNSTKGAFPISSIADFIILSITLIYLNYTSPINCNIVILLLVAGLFIFIFYISTNVFSLLLSRSLWFILLHSFTRTSTQTRYLRITIFSLLEVVCNLT